MKDLKISLIGCGKMASALSLGIHKKFPNLKFF
jgi:pyrroline-5-carboxylate reductase